MIITTYFFSSLQHSHTVTKDYYRTLTTVLLYQTCKNTETVQPSVVYIQLMENRATVDHILYARV
jgi:hypothetical protein